jgi:hypothetical protein
MSSSITAIFAETTRLDPAEIAQQLNTHLGPTLVALLANVNDRKLPRRWAKGEVSPRQGSEQRLRAAHRAWREIASAETDHVARAWFIGTNPHLGEITPIEALRSGRIDEVMAAASQFVKPE